MPAHAHGLQPKRVRVIPAAAGGPKGPALNPLDQYLFGDWQAPAKQPIHLLGASIGAWRMAAACLNDPAKALAEMARDYIATLPNAKLPDRADLGFFGADTRRRVRAWTHAVRECERCATSSPSGREAARVLLHSFWSDLPHAERTE